MMTVRESASMMSLLLLVTITVMEISAMLSWDMLDEVGPIRCPQPCSCYNALTTVDCSDQRLGTIPMLPEISTHLYLENNRIEYLLDGAFLMTPGLLILNLQNNQLTLLDTSVFTGLNKLQDLNLSKNQLIVFKTMQVTNGTLYSLKTLDLSWNQLQVVPRNLSQFAPNLQLLNLQGNLITSAFLDGSYTAMTSLKHLDLSRNILHDLQASSLDAIRNGALEILQLSSCSLYSMDEAVFARMWNLTSLSLAGNSDLDKTALIAALQAFTNRSELAYLDLRAMRLTTITRDMIAHLSNLEVLDLSNNSIETVEPGTLSGLGKLHTLYLHVNNLAWLNESSDLVSLRRLNLSSNKLQHISISPLLNLEYLDLSFNELSSLPDSWMCRSDTARLVNLSHNRLKFISKAAFQQVTIQRLDLSWNELSVLHNMGTFKVSVLNLAYNKLSAISESTFDHTSSMLEELDLSSNYFTVLPNHTYSDFVALQRLNLSRNLLGPWLSSHPVSILFSSLQHLQVLDLSWNNITSLPHRLTRHLSHLTTLHVQHNQIHEVENLAVKDMPSLAKLHMSANRLGRVDPASLRTLQYLEVVDFSNNPYNCDCDLIPLLHWLNVTRVSVTSLSQPGRYVCARPPELQGQPLQAYNPRAEDCLESHHDISQDLMLFGIIVAAVIGTTILASIIIYFGKVCQHIKSLHYRWQVRYREVSGVEFNDPKV